MRLGLTATAIAAGASRIEGQPRWLTGTREPMARQKNSTAHTHDAVAPIFQPGAVLLAAQWSRLRALSQGQTASRAWTRRPQPRGSSYEEDGGSPGETRRCVPTYPQAVATTSRTRSSGLRPANRFANETAR